MYLAVLSVYRVSHMNTSGIKYNYGPVGAHPAGDHKLDPQFNQAFD